MEMKRFLELGRAGEPGWKAGEKGGEKKGRKKMKKGPNVGIYKYFTAEEEWGAMDIAGILRAAVVGGRN